MSYERTMHRQRATLTIKNKNKLTLSQNILTCILYREITHVFTVVGKLDGLLTFSNNRPLRNSSISILYLNKSQDDAKKCYLMNVRCVKKFSIFTNLQIYTEACDLQWQTVAAATTNHLSAKYS